MKKRPASRTVIGITVIAAALALAFYFFLMPLVRKKARFRTRVSTLKGEIASEQERHRGLRRERRLLEEEDPAYLEKYARDNFGLARQEEIVYKLEKEK